jgi:hypothetical protein
MWSKIRSYLAPRIIVFLASASAVSATWLLMGFHTNLIDDARHLLHEACKGNLFSMDISREEQREDSLLEQRVQMWLENVWRPTNTTENSRDGQLHCAYISTLDMIHNWCMKDVGIGEV